MFSPPDGGELKNREEEQTLFFFFKRGALVYSPPPAPRFYNFKYLQYFINICFCPKPFCTTIVFLNIGSGVLVVVVVEGGGSCFLTSIIFGVHFEKKEKRSGGKRGLSEVKRNRALKAKHAVGYLCFNSDAIWSDIVRL